MKQIAFVLLVIVFFSCKQEDKFVSRDISSIEFNHLLEDSLLNVRALESYIEGNAYFATSIGEIGAIFPAISGGTGVRKKQLKFDSIVLNFRSLANTKNNGFALSIGSPAFLIKIGEVNDSIVYQENHPKAFYDSMDFWNDEEGIAIGDSTDGCLSVIITRDGGNTWNKLLCEDLPKGTENEGAFAASDTNIAIVGDKTWVATTAGRVYYSPDKGKTWDVFETPIVKEKETEGIYSIDFYNELNGFAIGGDYTKPDDNAANKIRTSDGGKTWELVAQNKTPNYRSCVQYIPNRKGKELVAIGFKGIDYSNDSGTTWKHLSDEGFYTIRFLNDSVAYAAGAGRISKLTFRE
ncbi:oxidoreductase [Gaetbulibacter sp. 4G1]|nr:oxidoreductase [Gaetbulibacter sp. 4G1]PIA79415.1 oxidoreductase [Gaetbulibacter sp. 4G1]